MEYYNNKIYYYCTNYQLINIYKVTISFIMWINVKKIMWENICKRMKKLEVKEKLVILNNNDIW